jgi:tetratricopeptide (TPR) repeat protein
MHRFQKRLLSACLAAWAACGAAAFAQDPAPRPEAPAFEAPAPEARTPEAEAPAPDRAARLDALYAELAEPGRADADRVEADIQRLWGQSGSPAMDLLLRRAQDAIAAQDLNAALDHLNAAIDHDPGFAEAWNLRGSVFYLLNEYALALNDIEHVLALEPRHFGAMEGLAIIFVETERPELALRVVERARAVNPNRESLKETEARLERDLGASDL